MKEKQNELNILEKQKKSLINEYITGKKRVKGYAQKGGMGYGINRSGNFSSDFKKGIR